MYDDELFTTIDYEEEGRDSLAFDPLSSPGQSDPVLKKFDKHGQFIEDNNDSWFKSSFSSQPKPTKAETDLVPMVEDSRFADDYSWWRKEDDYREWLRNQNLDPDKLDSYTGNKLFTEYIAYKAEHPDGFMKFSGDVMAKVGGVIRGVSDLLNKIPGIKHAVKPIGSILQFIGNIADMPRNVLAGAFTALATNNPEEILPNIFDAFKFSIGEVTGNEEGGKYFSWMDAKLMNLVEKAKQGMSENEYDKYINSDSFRQTKRFWQTGGLLLDLALDPAWFMGAFAAKSMKAAKTLSLEGKVFTEILDRVADIERTSKKIGIMSMDDVTRTITGDMNLFVKRSEKLIDFVSKDKSFVKAIGLETYEFGKSITDDIDAIGNAYRNAAKGELKSFETAFRLKIPLTDMDIRLSPSMDPLIDAVTKKIGGKPRGFLSIQGRQTERATAMLNQFSNVQEVIFRGAQDIGKAIDDLAAGGGNLGKMASEILKSPDQYKDLVAALFEANTPRLFEFIGIPTGEHAAKQKALFAVHEPLFKELLANPTIQTLRKDLDELFDGSYNKLQDAQRIHMRTAILAGGNVDDVADLMGVERKTIGEIYDKQYMKGRKKSINYGPESAMSTKYFYRQQSEEFLNWLKENELAKEFTDDPIKAQQVAADYMRIVRIPTDYKNDFLAKVLFDDDVRVALGDLFTEGRMDPAKVNRFKEAMAGVRQQSDQFNQWAKESGVGKAAPKDDYGKFKNLFARDEKAAFLMMNEKIRNIARVDRPFYKKLTEWSTKLDENGIPIKWDRVTDTASDIRPLITDASTSLMNDLSQKGLIFRGFTGRLYEGGFEPIYRKVLNDQRMIERLNSMSAILLEGQKGGWLKKINSPNDMINLDKSFVQINEGLFKGFAVQDYLEKPLQNAMKGIQNIVNEMPGNTNWVLERGKEYLEGFNRWWKVNIYMKNPAAHSRNFLANRLIMWGDGVSPWNMFSKAGKQSRQVWKYRRATDKYQEAVIKGGDTAMLKARMNQLGTKTIDFAGKRVSVMEATETLMRENVLSSGFTTTIMDEIHKAGEAGNYKDFAKMKADADKSFVKKWNPFGIKDELAENFGNMGSWIENRFGRLEHFFTLTGQQGKTIREAADQTNRILIDYGRISKTEDALRKYLIPFYCVPDNTEILTKKGWKFYNEISIGDSVLTYNLGSDRSEWGPIKDIAIFDYDGDLLEIGHSHHRFTFTKDHRVPVVKDRSLIRRIVRAYELKDGDKIPLAADVDIRTSSILTARDAALLAWIVTDGYFRWRGNHFESMIYQSPKKYAAKIRRLFGTYISSESIHPDTGVICFRLRAESTKRITKYFKSKNDLPGIVTRLNREALEGMFEAMMDAEGCRNNANLKYKNGMGDSFSQKLGPVIDAFQIICLLLGKSFHIAYSEKYDRAQGYVKKTRYLFYRKKFNKMAPYTGTIWCPKTENSTWYMRQNGRVMITGNTWTSRMIPIMFEKAITQPVYFSKVTQLKNNAYKILELDKNYAPLGEQVMEGIPSVSVADIPKFIAGKPMNEIRTQYLSGEGWLPQAVVNLFEPSKLSNLIAPKSLGEWLPVDMGKNILTGAVDYAGGSITPGIKVILESVSGYSFQFKRPLQVTPDQTVKFLSFNMSPKQANILRSVFGSLRHADDIINTWDKNAITGRPKYTVYDILWKNLFGYRPYNRDEIREIKGTLGELKQIYQSNLADARRKVYEPGQAQKHAHNALMAMHGIKALEWYRDFATEVRDKEATVRGIEQDIETLIERMQNPNLNKKQRAKYQEQEMTLQERLAAFMADQDKF